LRTIFVTVVLAVAAGACIKSQPEPVPIPGAAELARQLQVAATPDRPVLIEFEWRYRGRDGRYSGDGGVRVNPPDSVRLDLLGPGWSGVQSAVLLGDDIYYIGEQRIHLPPPTFMWSMLGVFRPPIGIVPQAARRGERLELVYRLSERDAVTFEFDAAGRLIEAEYSIDGDVVQTIVLEPGESGDGAWSWPKQARFRDLGDFHEVRIEVQEAREHERFEARIFGVPGR
jgi:hypothetical protein